MPSTRRAVIAHLRIKAYRLNGRRYAFLMIPDTPLSSTEDLT